METDSDLILRAKNGDAEAWRVLYRRYFPLVWRYASTQIEEVHLVEDIVSETMLALLKGIGSLEDDAAKISAWLRSVVRHKVADHHRQSYRLRERLEEVGKSHQDKEHSPSPSHNLETDETCEQVHQVLNQMTERQRLALEWKYGEGLKVKEIAIRLGETEKAVEASLFRARREFRKKFPFAEYAFRRRRQETSAE